NIHQSEKVTTILVTHSMEDALKYADHVIILNKGKVYMEGKPEEVLIKTNSLRKVNLDIPESILFLKNYIDYFSLEKDLSVKSINTRITFRYILTGLTPIWFLILFTFILHLFVTKEGEVIYEVFTLKIYSGGVQQGLMISLRFGLLIFMTSLLTLTTTPIEITDAIEELLRPLNKIKF